MLELEPKLSPEIVGGLHVPGGGIVEPYRLVFALVESAQKNGVQLMTGFEVSRSDWSGDAWTLYSESGEQVQARYVVNAAGLFADEVSRVLGAEDFVIRPRKGQYFLLDKLTQACPQRVLFPVPTQVSKGMLVIPTVHGTVLVGPTADEVEDKEDLATTPDQLEKIFDSARRMVPSVTMADVITSFAGLRPALDSQDFYIDVSAEAPRLIQVAGIQSPGLTAAPAIGEYVKDLLKRAGCRLTEKDDFDPYLDRVPRISGLSPEEVDDLMGRTPLFGSVVCRCEHVSEAEVVEAVRRGHTTLDGIKFFTRAGMGRCQGGFCTYHLMRVLLRETDATPETITKRGGESVLIEGTL
jgi:glycerol-3-phosphate dehydrogenase